jgi:uncharacterized protein (DUF2235 family)
MAKNIVLLSDGTGNSSATPFKTNVWRLYNHLDLTCDTQIAFYDNGVGSASNIVSRIAGGIFGYGLKRNILDLYGYLCRNYQPDDQIYGFGFSRGAFTMRMVIGMVKRRGLIGFAGDARAFERQIKAEYRTYRLALARNEQANGHRGPHASPHIICWMIAIWNWLWARGLHTPAATRVEHVRFIGVWDTVDAYGMPIEEIRIGYDKFLFPMTFRDHRLWSAVDYARHALSLDDERATFHPVLWDERGEPERSERILQLWFAGAHADVGGGYPDDRLAHVPLAWMMEEAEKAGLVFRPDAITQVRAAADALAPAHDSRKGAGLYYRYKPRRALRSHGDTHAPVRLHSSVPQRMMHSGNSYAPVALRGAAETVHGSAVASVNSNEDARASAQDYIWWRRLSYFAALAQSLVLVASPWIPLVYWAPGRLQQRLERAESFTTRFLDALVERTANLLDSWLPAIADPWINVFRNFPVRVLILVAFVIAIWRWSAWLDSRIHHFALATHGQMAAPPPPGAAARVGLNLARFLRTSPTSGEIYYLLFKQAVPLLCAILSVLALLWGGYHGVRMVEQSWNAAGQVTHPPMR